MKRSENTEEEIREQTVLATVDRALERGRPGESDAGLRELENLALALRELSPAPSPALQERLDRRVAEGFPRRRGVGALADPRPSRRGRGGTSEPAGSPRRSGRLGEGARRLLSPPALAGALSLLLVLVIAVPVLTGGRGSGLRPVTVAPTTDEEPSGMSREAQRPRPVEPGSGSGERDFPATGSGRDFAPGRRERRVERTGSLTLAAPDEGLEQVADDIVRIVDRHRGIVLSSSVSTGENASGGGTFSLRVPVGDLSATMRELSALGEVRARSQTGEDVTATVASAGERLAEERAERRSLLRRLERSDSATEAQAIRARLRLVGARIRSLTGQLQGLRSRTDYAAVSVSLVPEDADSGVPGSTDAAVDDFVDSLVGSFNFALRLLGLLIPIAVVVVPAAFAWRALRRRGREAALGS